jgi:hypothetical protein
VAKPFGLVLLDLYEIVASVWRTRVSAEGISAVIQAWQATVRSRVHKLRFTPAAAVIAVFLIATRWIPSQAGSSSQVSFLSAPQMTLHTAQQQIQFGPEKRPVRAVERSRSAGAPNSAFKRVQVAPNEVDYVAEDVTIRHFRPSPAPLSPRATYKQMHTGPDITMRYFGSDVTMRYVASKAELR